MKKRTEQIFIFILLLVTFFCCKSSLKENPEKIGYAELVRNLADTVGFSHTEGQIEQVVAMSEQIENAAIQKNNSDYRLSSETAWIAGICPHDDHLLAGRVYVHLFQNVRAKRIVLFGVAHKAWKWEVQDSLIFDSFDYWRGPYGNVKVSPLREEIIKRLSPDDFIINNAWQSEEHSVEGILPFIQYYRRDAEIVSILVPYMNWDRIDRLSKVLADVLYEIIQENEWKLGVDLAFISSNDGDHYGDQDWDGKNLASFGVDEQGYLQATQRDSNLIKLTLINELQPEKLELFTEKVWGDDLKTYKITWCGRFAIPFGLNCVCHLMQNLALPPLNGFLLRYGTSYALDKLPLPDIGIGTTAPNNIRHWVGYSAIGYK